MNFSILATKIVITLLSLFFLFSAALAEEPVVDPEPSLFEISGSEVRTIRSKSLGREYDLYIKLPSGYASREYATRKYPVIYLNDGGYCWISAVGMTRAPFNLGGYEKAILVGISYAKGDGAVDSRVRDYTPTQPAGAKRVLGGARDYLTFIKQEVIPFVEMEYHAESNRRMLVGHSYGALFGIYALLEEPGLFNDYVLTSPSFWHDDGVMFAMEEKALEGRVYMATGDTETPDINGGRNDMVGQQTRFAEQLRARGYDRLMVRDEVLDGGTHLTTFPIGFIRALRWMLPGDNIYGG